MNIQIGRNGLVAAATLALVLVSGAATAGQTPGAPTVRVRYSDLDLTRDEGVSELYARLRSAARQVCSDGRTRSLRQAALERACFDASLANAVAAARNERLAALHDRKEGRLPNLTAAL